MSIFTSRLSQVLIGLTHWSTGPRWLLRCNLYYIKNYTYLYSNTKQPSYNHYTLPSIILTVRALAHIITIYTFPNKAVATTIMVIAILKNTKMWTKLKITQITWSRSLNQLRQSYLISELNVQYKIHVITCSEFSIVNIQANALEFSLMASKPNSNVSPSNGSSTIIAKIRLLQKRELICSKQWTL